MSLFLAALLLVLLAGGLWIAIAMIVVGAVAVAFFTNTSAGALLATTVFGGSTDWSHGLRGGDPAVDRITKNILLKLSK